MLPVVAVQVIEVPKITLKDRIPQRTALRDPQLEEQLVEVPTVQCVVDQTVDIPVPGGGGRRGELQGLVPGQSSTGPSRKGLQGVSPGPGSAGSSRGGLQGLPSGQGSTAFGGAARPGLLLGHSPTALGGADHQGFLMGIEFRRRSLQFLKALS